jgi:D-mannonate dehydratase
MARIQVVSDDNLAVVEILTEDRDGEPWTYGDCRTCGERIEDRGHFEDVVEQARIHVDQRH